MYTRHDVEQKALKARDAWWTVLVIDPIVVRILPLLANRTKITPNQVTAISFLCGMLAVGFFLAHTPKALLAGAIFAELWFFFDCIDGKLARLLNASSKFGTVLDDVINGKVITILTAFALGYGSWISTHDPWYLLLPFWYIAFNFLYQIVAFWHREFGLVPSNERSAAESQHERLQVNGCKLFQIIKKIVHRLNRYPSEIEALTIVTFIGPLTNQVKIAFILGTLLMGLRSFGAMVLFFIRLRRAR